MVSSFDRTAEDLCMIVTFLLTITQEYLEYIEEPSDIYEFIEELKEAKTDQLGFDTIVYFPRIEIIKDEFNA